MNLVALIPAMIVALGVARVIFRLFFEDSAEFWECVRFSLTPDLFSLFRGEWLEDIVKSFKLSLYTSFIGIAGVATYFGIENIAG